MPTFDSKRILVPVAVVLAGGMGVVSAVGLRADVYQPDPPTFYADVLPIVQANCQVCHSPGGLNLGGMVAPMAFMTYEDVRRWAPLMAQAVKERRMPPWHADPVHTGTFRNERVMTDEDRATIIAWAEAGAPAGDPSRAPAVSLAAKTMSATASGWHIGEPDLVVQLPEPFLVEDDVNDLYVNIPVTITAEQHPEPRWIKAIEFQTGSKVVHHIIAGVLGGIAPGYEPAIHEDGYGVLLPAGPVTVVFQMHYHKEPGPGTAVYDQSKAGIVFYEPGKVIRHIVEVEPLGVFSFSIPPNESNYAFAGRFVVPEDLYIQSFNPHMHLRGRAARYEITYPDGRKELLLNVPRYDFNWQHTYRFKEPVFAPAGSQIDQILWWDNSAQNPANPDPTVAVRLGEPTTAEMGFGFMNYTKAQPLNVVVGEALAADIPAGGLPRSLRGSTEELGPVTGEAAVIRGVGVAEPR